VWLAYTTLTAIHTHLAVQYQVCVVAQPTTAFQILLRQRNAPEQKSDLRCVFRNAALKTK
jgi:hypothetical protein